MDRMLKAQLSCRQRIINFYTNSTDKAGAAAQTARHFETRLPMLEDYWEKFRDRHDDLTEFAEELKESEYFKDDLYTEVELEYVSAKARLQEKLAQLKPQPNPPAPVPVPQIAATGIPLATLPTIALPTFSGKQSEWESFKQRFSSLIRNKASVTPVEKLQHLLNAVQGPAAQRLKGLDVTEANFEVAWEKLVRRYDNTRIRLFNALENLIQLPSVKMHNVQDLNSVIDRSEEAVRALRDLQCPVDHYDNWIVHCILRKLDLRSRETWETTQANIEGFSTYASLLTFLERRIQTLEQARTSTEITDTQSKRNENSASRSSNRVSANNAQTTDSSSSKSDPLCDLCKGNHWLHRCTQFNAKTPLQRLEFCKSSKLCLNCLKKGHFVDKCSSLKRCFTCQAAHHTKLHLDSKHSGNKNSQSSENPKQGTGDIGASGDSGNNVAANSVSVGATVLLATARVVVANQSGKSLTIRALIDPGAERCFITQRTVQYLNLDTKRTSLSVIGVGATESSKCNLLAFGILKSSRDREFAMGFSALILNELTRCLPKEKMSRSDWPHLAGLDLADPNYAEPAKVDCILGADVYSALILNGLVKGSIGAPVAQRSVFGWLLTGAVDSKNSHSSLSAVRAHHVRTELALSQALSQFWEIEEIPRKALLTPDEERCENHFSETYSRDENGRFVIRLPFAKRPNFVGSREIAAACLAQSERRLQRNPQLAERYEAFLSEYVDLKHMELVPPLQINRPSFYMPHHAVTRPDNPTKIRVVFNASQKTRNGLSLNDLLLPGPKLQSDISMVLTHWRFFKFAFTTDVVKMFRQIKVHQDDADWQRILWRAEDNQAPQDFRCITVTYGTASAPYLALRVMKQLAIDGAAEYPEAAAILQHTLYVDDLFGGADTIDEALRRREQLVALLASAGMTLDKWAANQRRLLEGLNSTASQEVDVNSDEVISALGLKWLPKDDAFIFRVSAIPQKIEITKRSILSEIARLFDPLGWLAPVIVVAKIIMQDLWLDRLEWDEAVPQHLRDRWMQFRRNLADIPAIRIPRWLSMHEEDSWQLHGFADASQRAYAAAIYAVAPGHASVLLMAKTRVAPTKVQSLPRLELCATTLLARLVSHFLETTQRRPATLHAWSDSRVVLEWLKSHPSKWQTFIANRTSEIITRLPSATWRHVRSADNAADCATRGLSPVDLAAHHLWWHGPAWITKPESEWPKSVAITSAADEEVLTLTALEGKPKAPASSPSSCDCLPELQQFSRLGKIIRILIFYARWRLRAKKSQQNASLSQEWTLARAYLFRAIQLQHYKEERARLIAGESLSKHSPLARLSPFIGEQGLIRVGGRLHYSPLPYNERHPIVLPGSCIFVRRLIEDAHELTLHGGVQLMLSHLYRSCWITRGPAVAVGVLRRCIRCTRFGGRSPVQQMGSLPAERITPSRAFAITGLDYAGPVPVLFSRGRGAKATKGYIAIFICLVTRAIHIEIVSDLSSNAFIAAYARFCARRGVCEKIYSDNATTFKSSAKELQALFAKSSPFMDSVAPTLAFQGTEWSFIPPRAPHFGGLWEAAVRSFKHHFRRAIGELTLTFEELTTLAAKIEACLNSRPLCPLSAHATDATALTPAHFLVGSSLLCPPEPYDETDQPAPLNNRWRLLNNLRDSFWARWKKEVLHHMQRRNKWLNVQPNLHEGDVVLLTDELSPPTQWRLGLVTKTHPGADGLVRVVTVRTATSTFTRPVVKLIKLPTEPELVELYKSHASSNSSATAGDDSSS